jgi:multiple sugar transport system permease protein
VRTNRDSTTPGMADLPTKLFVRRRVSQGSPRSRTAPYLLVAGAVIVVICTNLIPLAVTLWDSLHKNSLLVNGHPFVGLSNYSNVLRDPAFQGALVNTLEYVVLAVAGVLALGLLFALWVRGAKHGKGLLIMMIIIPWAVPGTVNGAIWALILSPVNGFLNGVLKQLHLIDHNILWLQGPGALPLVCLTLVWQAVPIGALILLAGVDSIPVELYEQCRVDGAGHLRTFASVTLPLLRPAIAITMVQTALTGVSIFDQIYVLNGNAPSTISIVQQTYLYAFKNLNFGLGVSAAMISTIISLVVSLSVLAFVYREVEF